MMGLLLLVASAAAEPPSTPVATARGAFFALSVRNAEASAAWYSEKLGLRVIMNSRAQGDVQVVALEGGGLMVELIEQKGAAPLSEIAPRTDQDTKVHGLFKAGVIVDDWNGLIAGLKARGVPIMIGPFPATAEQRANLIIRDNEGNLIQFFESRPAPAETGKAD